MPEQLAVIRNVRIGAGDRGNGALWFDTYISESEGAMQVLGKDEAWEVIAQVEDVQRLEGMACWVETENPHGIIKFKRLWRAGWPTSR